MDPASIAPAPARAPAPGLLAANTESIAIIGMACVFPQAPDVQAFWRNIMLGVDAVGDPPPLWDAERYLASGRIKTPSGGYLGELFRFAPRDFGIMPNSVDGGEPDQFLALSVARDALADAGYAPRPSGPGEGGQPYDHRETGIILGHSTYLHRGQGTLIQTQIVVDQTVDLLGVLCPQLDADTLQQLRATLERKLPKFSADIAPALVPNVMTGRIANRLNLNGPNYLVDAACSSSLLAVSAAIDELRAGRSRMMIAGGVNASLPAEVAVIFTQLGALSGRGKVRPFDVASDGTLLGEGLGMVVLKRLGDALADGDRVYAVLRGVGQASDGRNQGLLAPNVEGEALAIRRAYDASGVDPASISLIEAHGTGIPLGDRTEIASLARIFGPRQAAQGRIALGSVKSMISHCIPAAGIAGLIKTALALHHKVLPPTLCDEINPELGLQQTPLYINTQAAPWIGAPGIPRRAGVNSFGFGGINSHAIVEEAPSQACPPLRCMPWPVELCVFSAASRAELVETLEHFAARLAEHPEWRIADIAATLANAPGAAHRLAMVVKDGAALAAAIVQALKRLRTSDAERWSTRAGIVYSARPLGGQLAFVFPGEGSQYPGMLADLAQYFDEVREWLDFWCALYPDAPGARRTDIVYPPVSELTRERREALERRLHDMDVGSEAVFIGGQAMHALLRALGVTPDVMLGHSSGESSALAASGAFGAEDRAQLAESIRRLNTVYRQILDDGKIPTGALLTVGALPLEAIGQHIAQAAADIVVAMDNCTNQVVLYGAPDAIDAIQQRLVSAGGVCMLLPFDRGYHTPAFVDVSAAFATYYDDIRLRRPALPLYSCSSAQRFPADDEPAFRALAAAQWSSTVRFRETILRMHDDGVRSFIEVGPSANLSAFINDILAGRDYLALASNVRRRGGVEQLLTVLAQLYVEAQPLHLAKLFATRIVTPIDFSADRAPAAPGLILDNTMPKIRLTESERAALRGLAAVAPAAQPPAMSAALARMDAFLHLQRGVLHQWQAARSDGTGLGTAAADVSAYAGFLDYVLEYDGAQLLAECHLSVFRDHFLKDHVLSGSVSAADPELTGLSCVPMMVSLEIMAEAAALLAGSAALHVIENVAAFDWIALDHGELTLKVHAQTIDAARGHYRASLTSAGGVAVSAEFRFQPEPRCPALAPLQELRPSVWNGEALYSTGMFHGPVFQSIRHIDGWDDSGIDAQLSSLGLRDFFVPGGSPSLILNPVLLDAMGQLAAYWIAQQAGTDFNCFPSTIERIELYAACPQDLPDVRLRARQQPVTPGAREISAPRAWQFECVDAQGQPLVRVSRLLNVYFQVPHRFYEVRRDPLNGWLGQALTPLVGAALLWRLDLFADDFCAQSGSIFLRILAHALLSFEECEAWQALTGSVAYRRQWLLGRACIKEAVRYWVHQQTGQLLYPADIVVLHDEYGAPYVDGPWCDSLIEAPRVSLSHDARCCVAAVADAQLAVGVDVEPLGRIQRPELLVEALTPDERSALAGLDGAALQERMLRIWCAKEAAMKCLGLGFQGQPQACEVRFTDTYADSAQAFYQDTAVRVDLRRDADSIIAVASEADAAPDPISYPDSFAEAPRGDVQ